MDHSEDSERVNTTDFSDSKYGEDVENSQLMDSANNEENSQMLAMDNLESQHDSDMSEDSYKDDDWIVSNGRVRYFRRISYVPRYQNFIV